MGVQLNKTSPVVVSFTKPFDAYCCIHGKGLYSDEVRRLRGDYDHKDSRYNIRYARAACNNGNYFNGPLNAQRQAEGTMGTFVWNRIHTYVGKFLKGLFHGFGVHAAPDGIYLGSFENGRRHGMGTVVSLVGRVFSVTYEKGQLKSKEEMEFTLGQNQNQPPNAAPQPFQDRVVSIAGEDLRTYKCSEGLYSTSGKVNRLVGPHPWKDSQYQISEAQVEFEDGRYFIGEFNPDTRNARNWGTLIFKTGAASIGNYREGMLQGQGVFVYSNGDTIVGNFVNGKRHGKGMMIYSSANRYVRFCGDFYNDKLHGQGKLELRDGGIYEGDFNNDECHGQGKLVFRDGGIYEGNFSHSKRTGYGTFTYPQDNARARYQGSFSNNERHGQGRLEYRDGTTYEGNWKNDKRHGEIIVTYPDGRSSTRVYEEGKLIRNVGNPNNNELPEEAAHGVAEENLPQTPLAAPARAVVDDLQAQVADASNQPDERTEETLQLGTATFQGPTRNGKPHGTGILHFEDGSSYSAEFNDGIGQITEHVFRDGRIYTGKWSNGHFNGRGLLQFPYGHEFHSYKGIFVDGQFEDAKATLNISRGDKYVGAFSRNLRHGRGMLFNALGRHPQTWEMGVHISS